MSAPALLDLNDTKLQLWHGEAALRSPGYALLNGNQYTFGSSARSAARLRPRDINTRYWWQLNTEKLQPALGPARHTADLVHAHLLDIHTQGGKPDEIILAVPGSMAKDQLALLLGIIGQCPFTAVGLVNRSVLLGSAQLETQPLAGRMYHLEIQLHQAVISQLGVNAGQFELLQTTPLPGCGLLQLQERLVELVAAAFVRQTRFDPRRKADSEQQLYDALPGVLSALNTNPEANVEVMGYRARLNRAELRSASEMLLGSAPEAIGNLQAQDQIIIDPVAGLLPGLLEKIPRAILLDDKTLPHAAQLHGNLLVGASDEATDDALSFITALPCPKGALTPEPATAGGAVVADQTAVETAPPQIEAVAATHLLIGAVARTLHPEGTPLAQGYELLAQDGNWQIRGGKGIWVNNAVYTAGQALFCGDQIQIKTEDQPDFSALLIAVDQP